MGSFFNNLILLFVFDFIFPKIRSYQISVFFSGKEITHAISSQFLKFIFALKLNFTTPLHPILLKPARINFEGIKSRRCRNILL